jgi:hypothetical protein
MSSLQLTSVTTTLTSQIYQITAHKIQVFNESDQSVEPRLIPQLPGGETNNDGNAKMNKDSDDLLAAFTAKKKMRMDTE